MAIEISISADRELVNTLNRLAPTDVYRAVASASKRAATATRTAGTKRLRGIYTIKSGDLKRRAAIKKAGDGSVLEIKGPTENIKKYKAAKKSYGIFATVKRGQGVRVPRSFELGGNFLAREGKARYPLKGIYGPAVPQLFGNPEVLEAMEERGSEVFESRLYHEIDRLLGGA